MWFMEWEKPALFYLLNILLSQVHWDKLQVPTNLKAPPQSCISHYILCTHVVQNSGLSSGNWNYGRKDGTDPHTN